MRKRWVAQNLGMLEDDKLYSIRELVEITQVPQLSIRDRIFRYQPRFELKDGLMHYEGRVAKEFLAYRKSGKSKKII